MNRRRLHLIWIAVVALAIDALCLLGAIIGKCGVSGCGGGGFGVSSDPVFVVIVIAGAGLATAAMLVFVPWHGSRRVRIVVAAVAAVATWLVLGPLTAG